MLNSFCPRPATDDDVDGPVYESTADTPEPSTNPGTAAAEGPVYEDAEAMLHLDDAHYEQAVTHSKICVDTIRACLCCDLLLWFLFMFSFLTENNPPPSSIPPWHRPSVL